jgi:hypothetical protein
VQQRQTRHRFPTGILAACDGKNHAELNWASWF